jgi:hypothetical protein
MNCRRLMQSIRDLITGGKGSRLCRTSKQYHASTPGSVTYFAPKGGQTQGQIIYSRSELSLPQWVILD